jgi:hypothetical protein
MTGQIFMGRIRISQPSTAAQRAQAATGGVTSCQRPQFVAILTCLVSCRCESVQSSCR